MRSRTAEKGDSNSSTHHKKNKKKGIYLAASPPTWLTAFTSSRTILGSIIDDNQVYVRSECRGGAAIEVSEQIRKKEKRIV